MKQMKQWLLLCCVGALTVPGVQAAPKSTTPSTSAPKAAGLSVQGRIVALTRPPRPGSVPYKDAIIALRLKEVKPLSGKLRAREIVVFAWGMRRNKRTPLATYRVGQSVKFMLTPWEKAERKYGSYNRFELSGDDVYALDTYWGELK